MRTVRSRSGYTTLELLLATTLAAIVAGGLLMTLERGRSLYQQSAALTDLDLRASRSLHRIASPMLGTAPDRLTPSLETPAGADTVWASSLAFRVAESYAGGATTWGSTGRVEWVRDAGELDNDLDDDGDGLVDEGAAVLTLDVGLASERSVTVVNGVAEWLEGEELNGVDDNGNGLIDEPGLCFDVDGGTLNIQLTLERRASDGTTYVRTQGTSAWMRNSE